MSRLGITAPTIRLVFARAEDRCEYCQSPQDHSPDPFSIEHIHPQALGGSHEADNLALSCQGCNGFKGARVMAFDAVSEQEVRLFHPRRDAWPQHFEWSEDRLTLRGLSPTGRATIEALRLNRLGVRNLRAGLLALERHPAQPNPSSAP